MKTVPTSWHPCYRIIPSRFPPINLFERVADPKDLEVAFALFTHLQDPDPATYGAGQAVGRQAKVAGCDGVRFMSVRRAGGECAAVLRPKVLSAARQAQHLIYPWDGLTIHPERICVKTLL